MKQYIHLFLKFIGTMFALVFVPLFLAASFAGISCAEDRPQTPFSKWLSPIELSTFPANRSFSERLVSQEHDDPVDPAQAAPLRNKRIKSKKPAYSCRVPEKWVLQEIHGKPELNVNLISLPRPSVGLPMVYFEIAFYAAEALRDLSYANTPGAYLQNRVAEGEVVTRPLGKSEILGARALEFETSSRSPQGIQEERLELRHRYTSVLRPEGHYVLGYHSTPAAWPQNLADYEAFVKSFKPVEKNK